MSLYGILSLSHSTEMPDGKVELSCTVVFLPVLDKVGCIGINSQSFRRYTYKKYAYKKHAYKKHLQKFTLNWAVLRILSVGCFFGPLCDGPETRGEFSCGFSASLL